jgi:anaerobic selenocysteine-containing dehydrogenase
MGGETTGKAVCPYCGVGCVIQATVLNNKITKISADKEAAPNFGMLCQKGAYLKDAFQNHDGRLTHPMIRDERGGEPRRVSWDEAIAFITRRLSEIDEAHEDAIAYCGSGQLDTEASYLFTKFFKGSLRTNHMDTNSRLCMSSAVVAYVKAFGSDGPPTNYDDIEHADVFLMIGANMAANHPVLFQKMRKRRSRNPNARIIVVDPARSRRSSPTCTCRWLPVVMSPSCISSRSGFTTSDAWTSASRRGTRRASASTRRCWRRWTRRSCSPPATSTPPASTRWSNC